jgi:hypothetical protein
MPSVAQKPLPELPLNPPWIAPTELPVAKLALKEALENPKQCHSRPDTAKTIRWQELRKSCYHECPITPKKHIEKRIKFHILQLKQFIEHYYLP